MSFLKSMRRAALTYLAKDYFSTVDNTFIRQLQALGSLNGGSRSIQDKLSQIKENKSWVFACVDKIANEIASTPGQIYKNTNVRQERVITRGGEVKRWVKDWEPKEDPEIMDAIESPFKPYGTEYGLKKITVVSLGLTGEFFWNKLTAPNGKKLLGFSYVNPAAAKANVNQATGELINWELQTNTGNIINLPIEQVVFGCFPRLDNYFRGMSPIEAVAADVDLNGLLKEYSAKLLRNDGRASLMLSPDSSIEEDQLAKLQAWAKNRNGSQTGKTIVFPIGVKAVQEGLGPRELGFTDGRRSTRDEILAAYSTPLILIEGKDANRSTLENATQQWLQDCIYPWLTIIEDTINRQVVWPLRGRGFAYQFNRRVIEMAEDKKARQSMEFQFNATTVNEYRAARGLTPVSWGDEKPNPRGIGNVFDLTGNQPPEPAKSEQVIIVKGGDEIVVTEGEGDQDNDRLFKWKAFDNVLQSVEEPFAGALARYYKKLGEQVKDRVKQQYNSGQQISIGVLDTDKAFALLSTIATPHVLSGIKRGYAHAGLLTRKPQTFNPEAPRIKAKVTGLVDKNGKEMIKTTGAKLSDLFARMQPKKAVKDANLAETISVDFNEFLVEIDSIFAERIDNGAWTAASTMSEGTVNWGQVTGYTDAGIKKHEWLDQQDDRVRDTHQLTGEIRAIGERFSNGLEYPGDEAGPPEETINCRCTTLPVIEE